MTEWFLTRLPEGGDDQGQRWRDLNQETAGLSEWLAQVRPDDRARVGRVEELAVYERLGDARYLLFGRWNLASTLLRRGREEDREEARGLLIMALDEARRLKLPAAEQIEQLVEQAR